MTTVINIRNAPPNWQRDPRYVYIGRPGRGLAGPYGNPHAVGMCRECGKLHARGEAVAAFNADATKKYALDSDYRALVEKLRDKILICFCKPKACHGDIYVEILEYGR